MRKKFYNKIAVKTLLVVIIGLIVATSLFLLFGNYALLKIFNLNWNDNPIMLFYAYNLIVLIMVLLAVGSFLLIFFTAINRRMRYFQYIVNSLKDINEVSYLKRLDIIGKDEFSELAESINIMSSKIEESYAREKRIEGAKNELITSVSHDLKTPLTSIIGYLELLKKENYKDLKEEKYYIEVAYNKSLRLNNLVNDLFEFTKLNSSEYEKKEDRFNIAILLNQVIGESILFFQDRNIEVELINPYEELYYMGDQKNILRVFENLIKNAEKYALGNSKFTIELKKNSDNIEISFKNKTNVMKEEEVQSIFEKFYRIDKSRSSSNEGSGLGLAISKKIIELHGGTIKAEYKEGFIDFIILL